MSDTKLRQPQDVTLLDVLIDGFEKNDVLPVAAGSATSLGKSTRLRAQSESEDIPTAPTPLTARVYSRSI